MALEQSGAAALAIKERLDAPAASGPSRPQVVLEEDEYTEKLERIIERDFFPDVPKLQSKLEWLQAVNSGDPAAILNAQINIAARRGGVPTPIGATPAQFATPAGAGGFGTPASARPGSALRPPLQEEADAGERVPGGGGGSAPGPYVAEGGAAPAEGLNSFLAKHTSEDNASFSEIMEEGRKRARERNAWLYQDKNRPPPGVLLLEGGDGDGSDDGGEALQRTKRPAVTTDGYGTGNAPDGALLGWKHVPKNQLYYHKDGTPFSSREKAERAAMATKRILHSNTRLPGQSHSSTGLFSPEGGSRAATPAPGGEGAGTGAYNRVATPSMTPGADGMSPLMTWGDIESTPLRIDAEDIAEAGPSFRVPEVPSRDLLGRKLAAATPATAKHRLASSSRAAAASPLSVLRRGYGGGTPTGTPGRAATPLSAAAKRLASQIRGASPAARQIGRTDLGLRASYAQSGSRQGAKAAATPTHSARKPPSSSRRQTPMAASPMPAAAAKAKEPRSQAPDPAKKGSSASGRSLTDGLLKI